MMNKTFGQILTDAMEVKDMTRKELAGMLDISTTAVAYYCKDKRVPPTLVMIKLCKILQLNLNEIYHIDTGDITNRNLLLLRKYDALETEDKDFVEKIIDTLIAQDRRR